jgi:hypothetical protein
MGLVFLTFVFRALPLEKVVLEVMHENRRLIPGTTLGDALRFVEQNSTEPQQAAPSGGGDA